MSGKKERIELSPKTMENFLVGEFSEKKKQKPERKIEIDEKYVAKKVEALINTPWDILRRKVVEEFITQIISDVKGGKE